jgi:hypothetical protein
VVSVRHRINDTSKRKRFIEERRTDRAENIALFPPILPFGIGDLVKIRKSGKEHHVKKIKFGMYILEGWGDLLFSHSQLILIEKA